MNAIKFAALALVVAVSAGSVCQADELTYLSRDLVIRADWQAPLQLPPRFRNHCRAENFTGRPYCSDHCGVDYQVFYCSEASFGCCRLGHGYCDWNGHLRCAP